MANYHECKIGGERAILSGLTIKFELQKWHHEGQYVQDLSDS